MNNATADAASYALAATAGAAALLFLATLALYAFSRSARK